ncbi:MAG: hypothetical protein V8Q79_11010 [Christensenellales bacterium]
MACPHHGSTSDRELSAAEGGFAISRDGCDENVITDSARASREIARTGVRR